MQEVAKFHAAWFVHIKCFAHVMACFGGKVWLSLMGPFRSKFCHSSVELHHLWAWARIESRSMDTCLLITFHTDGHNLLNHAKVVHIGLLSVGPGENFIQIEAPFLRAGNCETSI
jgi:hypothetical protein